MLHRNMKINCPGTIFKDHLTPPCPNLYLSYICNILVNRFAEKIGVGVKQGFLFGLKIVQIGCETGVF